MIRSGALLIVLIIIGSQAAAAQEASSRYNLSCSGKYRDTTYYPDDNKPMYSEDTWTYNYRVDLIRNKWCETICSNIRSFAAVTDTELVFYDNVNEADNSIVSGTSTAKLNRITGQVEIKTTAFGRSGWRSESGAILTCSKLPFTPFPQPKF